MKNNIIYALLLMPSTIWAQSSFALKGRVGKLDKPVKAYLLYSYKDQRQIDSIPLKDGYYSFKGKIDFPTAAAVVINHDGTELSKLKKVDQLELYLEAKAMQISTVPDSVAKAHVLNSAINDEKAALVAKFKASDKVSSDLYYLFMRTPIKERTSDEFQNSFQQKSRENVQSYKDIKFNFIKEHPNSLVSLEVLRSNSFDHPNNPDTILTLFKGLSTTVKNSISGMKYYQSLMNAVAISIGKNAPDFALPDTTGNILHLSSFHGKYVLIDFWASWCKPCRAENPNLVNNYEEFHAKGLEIIGVSLDRDGDRTSWINAIHQDKLTWWQVSDLKYWKSEAVRLYAIQSIPANVLIDPHGKIIAKNIRGEELNKTLAKFLNQ